MIAAIEIGKKYAQVCVKTDRMREPESVTKIAGTEHYRIPVKEDISDPVQLQELFRDLWKMLSPYGNQESLEYLVFCLEENTEKMRAMLRKITQIYNIQKQKVCFLDRSECFCAYVFHQGGDLLMYQALLVDHRENTMEKYLLQKYAGSDPCIVEIKDRSKYPLEEILEEERISSVFLVGDDYEEQWMQEHKSLLKKGKRVFIGKNLYVKGACCHGMELKAKKMQYLYLCPEKVACNIMLRSEEDGKESWIPLVEAGKYWYEANTETEVLLLEEPELEFALIPIGRKEKKTMLIRLEHLPERPKKTTRLQIRVEFTDASHAKILIKDLGFGEIFPPSDLVYEGELKWEQ